MLTLRRGLPLRHFYPKLPAGIRQWSFWKCCVASALDMGGKVQIPTANLRSDLEEGDLEYEVTVIT